MSGCCSRCGLAFVEPAVAVTLERAAGRRVEHVRWVVCADCHSALLDLLRAGRPVLPELVGAGSLPAADEPFIP